MKAEDLLIVAREGFEAPEGFEICGEELIQSAVSIVFGSFVSAALSNINNFTIIVQRRNHAYLDLAVIAEKSDVYESLRGT